MWHLSKGVNMISQYAKEGMIGLQKQFTGAGENDLRVTYETKDEYIVMLIGGLKKGQKLPTDPEIQGMLWNLGFIDVERLAKHVGKEKACALYNKVLAEINAERP
jgi:hypothetical protein